MFFAGRSLRRKRQRARGGLARKVEPESRSRGQPSFPSPLPSVRGLVAGGPFEKFAKLNQGSIPFWPDLDRAHNANYGNRSSRPEDTIVALFAQELPRYFPFSDSSLSKTSQ